MLACRQSQPKPTRQLTDFLWATLDFDEPSGIGNMIQTYRATIQLILLPALGIGLRHSKIRLVREFAWPVRFRPVSPAFIRVFCRSARRGPLRVSIAIFPPWQRRRSLRLCRRNWSSQSKSSLRSKPLAWTCAPSLRRRLRIASTLAMRISVRARCCCVRRAPQIAASDTVRLCAHP